MHLEILVEGSTEKTALETLLPKIIGKYGTKHTWRIHNHRGKGKLPVDPKGKPNPKDPTLLHNLPSLLRAYGKAFMDNQAIVVLVDQDEENCLELKSKMVKLLKYCNPKPNATFRIACEELEAWYLGDREAIIKAYPKAKKQELNSYKQDKVCGTWEVIAEAVHPGGLVALNNRQKHSIPEEKRQWAINITKEMNVDANVSESFCHFRDRLKLLCLEKKKTPVKTKSSNKNKRLKK